MATVTLNDVRKSFGDIEIVHGVDVDITDGEMIVIVGPSGCGKSTLLRMVAGLETVTSGEIRIAGKRVNEMEPMDRDIAMVFQNYALYPHMSVFDNMAYGLKIAGRPKAEIAERVRATAKLLQLEDYLERKPRQLSGGQRQRVAMGRAIVRKPAVFLFDEPLSNLDAKLRVQMRLDIKALQRQLGVTALYVTHDQVEAMTLADRMIVMNDGRAEQIGAPLDVYADPATQFVAGFIGSPPMNFMPADILPDNVRSKLNGNTASAATVGIRPEHVQIGGRAGASLKAIADHAEALGAETLIHVRLTNGGRLTVRQEGVAKVPAEGAEISVRFDPAKLCFFDAEGGRIRN